MSRKFGIGILIFCFGLSSVNVAWATQVVDVQPIIVQPADLQEVSQQMLEYDRQNRDQELAIRGLIDDNQKLTDTALAGQQDATLEKIKQIMANDQNVSPRYRDLVHLTEDVDYVKGTGETMELTRDVIEEKYKILTDLKDEMMALNAKLQDEAVHQNYEAIDHQQAEKIQLLTQRLGEMDQRIARYDGILAEKEQQVAQLRDNLARLQSEAATQDEIIKEQKNQIDILSGNAKEHLPFSAGNVALPPIIVNGLNNQRQAAPQVMQTAPVVVNPSQADQLARLQGEVVSRDEIIRQQENQIAVLKAQTSAAREEKPIDSIRWLKQVLAVTKDKAEYYKLTSQRDQMTVQEVQKEVQDIKDDFARHLKEYNQFETAIFSLKSQVGRLGVQLSQKQGQVDLLKSALENKTTRLQDRENQIIKMRSDIRDILQAQANKEIYHRRASAQLDDRVKLAKELIGLQEQEASLLDEKGNLEAAYNTVFEKHASDLENKINDLLVNHQIQTADLKNRMEGLKNELDQKEQQAGVLKTELENKIAQEKDQSVLVNQIQDLKAQLQGQDNQITAMKAEVQSGQDAQEQADTLRQQVMAEQDKENLLKQQLDSKTAESNKLTLMMGDYQNKLESRDNAYNEQSAQIADLNAQLQNKEAQIVKIKKDMYEFQELINIRERNTQVKDLSLSMEQQKMVDEKINEYQAKINGLQVTNVNQLQVITNLKNELALARQQLEGVPSRDELEFLRTGLKRATMQLKQRDAMLAEIRANAGEYAQAFKKQTREFQSLKDQLQDAQQEIESRDEDLKYKDMAITRLKDISRTREKGLQDNIEALKNDLDQEKDQLGLLKAELENKATQDKDQSDLEDQVQDLKDQLQDKEAQIVKINNDMYDLREWARDKTRAFQALKDQLQDAREDLDRKNEDLKYKNMAIVRLKEHAPANKSDLQAPLKSFPENDPVGKKLKQALDKIDEQGRLINALVQKLQNAGQSVDLTKVR